MRALMLAGAALFTLAGAASAQESEPILQGDHIIALRQAMMDLQQGGAAAMKAAVETKADVKPLVAGAKGLVASTGLITTMFPHGSERGHETRAKPEIWSDPSGFEKAAANARAQAEALVKVAEANDQAGFATGLAAMGQACGSCHRQYRTQ
jgi:cytochrome c556